MAYLVRDRPIGTGSILSSPQAASVSGFGNLRKSVSGRKPRKSWMLGKKPQIAPPPGTWTRPGSEKSFWRLSSVSRASGPTLQRFRNDSSAGFGLRRAVEEGLIDRNPIPAVRPSRTSRAAFKRSKECAFLKEKLWLPSSTRKRMD